MAKHGHPWPEKKAEPIPDDETAEEWQARIFAHFDCADVNGHPHGWETLAYAMLLELRPDLISADPTPTYQGAPRGRPKAWDAAKFGALLDAVERTRAEHGYTGHGGDTLALLSLMRRPAFKAQFGDTLGTLRNRLSEARRIAA